MLRENFTAAITNDGETIVCDIQSSNDDVNPDCVIDEGSLILNVFGMSIINYRCSVDSAYVSL